MFRTFIIISDEMYSISYGNLVYLKSLTCYHHHNTIRPLRLADKHHYGDVIMGAITSQITSLANVYSAVYSDADQRKHQSSASLAFVWGIHRGPVNSPHKWQVTRKMFLFDDVIMYILSPSGYKPEFVRSLYNRNLTKHHTLLKIFKGTVMFFYVVYIGSIQ